MLDWESLARAQFRQGVAKEHNLGALAMNKRGGGRAAVVKVEAPVPAVMSNGSATATASMNASINASSSSAALGESSSSDGFNAGGTSSTAGDESHKMDISSALPGSSSSSESVRDFSLAASIASNTAALDVGLLGVTPDIVNRCDMHSVVMIILAAVDSSSPYNDVTVTSIA